MSGRSGSAGAVIIGPVDFKPEVVSELKPGSCINMHATFGVSKKKAWRRKRGLRTRLGSVNLNWSWVRCCFWLTRSVTCSTSSASHLPTTDTGL